jgi:16S rRNA (guanine527-N7)-methyltransferase
MDQSISPASLGVSRETFDRLQRFKSVFDLWQKRINLVAPGTVSAFWQRHVADSVQLDRFAPDAAHWVDLGSGGGFPGLVLAALRTEHPLCRTSLIESNGKKAAFLREAARTAGISAEIQSERLESALPRLTRPIHVISARALAPLPQLVAWTEDLLKTGSLGLYLKGRDATSEIDALDCPASLRLERFPSRIDGDSSVVAIWNPELCAGPIRPDTAA